MMKKKLISIVSIFSVLLLLSSCKKSSLYKYNKSLIGTEINLTIIAKSEEYAVKTSDKVFNEIARIESSLSPFRKESDLYRINQFADSKPVKISDETFALIERSVEISSETEGSFDITFASLSPIWNFRSSNFLPPNSKEILRLLPLVNYRHINLNKESLNIEITKKGTKIGLGAIAKGYAVKRGIEILKAMGIEDSIIEAGGDLQVLGNKFNKSWNVGLKNPRTKGILLSIALCNMDSIATSGDYERFAMHNGKRYHHIIDPKSGYPATSFASVSVITKNPVDSDAFATALFVMGKEKAKTLIKKKQDIHVIFIDLEMNISASKELKERITPLEDVKIKWI